jgi:acetyl-CoA acetyltransferase
LTFVKKGVLEIENLRDKIAIVGIGETKYMRRPDRGAKDLMIQAVQRALDDAKIDPKEVDGIVSQGISVNLLSPSELAYNLGIPRSFSANISGSGAGSMGAPFTAAMAIATGQADVVVAYYGLNFGETRRESYTYGDHGSWIKASFEMPYGLYGPSCQYPTKAHRYMYEYGIPKEQFARQLGAIAVNQRRNALLNGNGVLKKPLTMEDYLNSPIIADPLRLPDYCLMNDGACAFVMTSIERAKDCPKLPVIVMGVGFGGYQMTDADTETQSGKDFLYKTAERQALDKALRMADITRDDLDFAEIYDSFTIMLLLFFESLGFCEKGEGGAFAESGIISLEGSLPVNTHGGHLSHSMITGSTHVIEAVKQLRGEAGACQVKDAEIGLVCGGSGGIDGAATILRKY